MCCAVSVSQQENPRDTPDGLLHPNLKWRPSREDDLTHRPARFPRPADSAWNFQLEIPVCKTLLRGFAAALLLADLPDNHRKVARDGRENRYQALRLTINQEHHLRN